MIRHLLPFTRSFSSPAFVSTILFRKVHKKQLELNSVTISSTKFDPASDGFVLYQNTQGKSIKLITSAMLLFFLSGIYIYSKLDHQMQINYQIIGILLSVTFVTYCIRINKTLKKLVLTKAGDQIRLTVFKFGGYGEETIQAKTQILTGIRRATRFGGNAIHGGGIYGFEKRHFWFSRKFIIAERDVFESVAQGEKVKIIKQ